MWGRDGGQQLGVIWEAESTQLDLHYGVTPQPYIAHDS